MDVTTDDAPAARVLVEPDADGWWVHGTDGEWERLALDLARDKQVRTYADDWNGPVLWRHPDGHPVDQPTALALNSLLAAGHISTTMGGDVTVAKDAPAPWVEVGTVEYGADGSARLRRMP